MDNNKDIWRPVPAASLAIRHGDTTAMLSIEDQLDGVLFEVETHTVVCGVESHSELVIHVTSTADLKLLSMQLSEMYERRVAREAEEQAKRAEPIYEAHYASERATGDHRLVVRRRDTGETVKITESPGTRIGPRVKYVLEEEGFRLVCEREEPDTDGSPVYLVREK